MTEEEDRQAYLKELNDTFEFEGKKITGAYAIGRTLVINYPPKCIYSKDLVVNIMATDD